MFPAVGSDLLPMPPYATVKTNAARRHGAPHLMKIVFVLWIMLSDYRLFSSLR